jgi:hypothetical protein
VIVHTAETDKNEATRKKEADVVLLLLCVVVFNKMDAIMGCKMQNRKKRKAK